ncbi:MAG TPA: hypothetical protein VNT79_14010, partial [Phycisphaerae bacterium]|nr:hypothetical protein [Phycisphaerae bacterium]
MQPTSEIDRDSTRGGRLSVWVLTSFLAGVAVAWLLWAEAFVTDDSYFYLVIARNIAGTGRQSFNQVMPTN